MRCNQIIERYTRFVVDFNALRFVRHQSRCGNLEGSIGGFFGVFRSFLGAFSAERGASAGFNAVADPASVTGTIAPKAMKARAIETNGLQ